MTKERGASMIGMKWVAFAMAGWATLALAAGPVSAGPNEGVGISIDFATDTVGDQKMTTAAGAGVVVAHVYVHNVSNLAVIDFTLNLPDGVALAAPVQKDRTENFVVVEGSILESAGAEITIAPLTSEVAGGLKVAITLPADVTASQAPEGSGLIALLPLSLADAAAGDLNISFGEDTFLADANQNQDFIVTANTNNVGGTINASDTAAPGAITALMQTNLGTATGAATISWENSAAEAGGKYIFKYSSTEITDEAGWDAASVVTNANFDGTLPGTGATGTQGASIRGVTPPNVDLFLHGRIVDASNNLGPISASAMINVPPGPSAVESATLGEVKRLMK